MSSPSSSFWTVAAGDRDRIAVIEDGRTRSFGELLDAANQLVHGLRAEGLRAGDVVAVALPNQSELLEVYFAAMQAGWYFLPVGIALTASEIAYLLRDSGAKMAITGGRAAEAVAAACAEAGLAARVSVDERAGFRALGAIKAGRPTTLPTERTAGERMSYTSGTTGRPKAVHRPLEAMSPEARAAAAALHLRAAARITPGGDTVHLVSSPLYLSAGLLWCTDHLHLGHTVVLMEKWTPEGALERIARHRVTASFMVPTHFRRLLALPDDVRARYDCSSLRHVVHSGAPCPVDVKRRMLAWWGPVIYETYASTEGPGTQVSPTEWLAHPGTVGRTMGRVRVLREDGAECAPGEVGAVYLALGPRPFTYRGAAEKTEASRRDGWFSVGDLGYVDEAGWLFLVDRSADVVISGGVNVYPAEVEAALGEHAAVADCAVFGVPDEEWGEALKALVELAPGATAGPALVEELIAHCRGRLAPYKCPRSIDFTEALPREPSGKLSRRRLREPYWAGRARKI